MSTVDFTPRAPRAGELDVRWIHGSPSAKHNTDPDIQVHHLDDHTVIMRQNMAIDYEAPFMFLLFGNDRAVLIDTGATRVPEWFPIRRVVDDLVGRWLAQHPRPSYELLVLHSHPHGDHVAGDGQFADRPHTVMVGAEKAEAWAHLGLTDDLDLVARIDLGGRMLECVASPGHHCAAVTFYDPYAGLLLTGDTIYPGRLYITDWAAFRATIDRLIAFAEGRVVHHVLGCHIEMTATPGVDYPVRTTYQPDEPPLQLPPSMLREVRSALEEIGAVPQRRAFGLFILWPEED